jgi:hypothetical protein
MPNAKLVTQLCGFGSQIPRIAGTGMLARIAPLPVTAAPGGTITQKIWGNDVITPAGTYYTFAIVDDSGNTVQLNAYQFAGTATVDLSTAAPYDPIPPLPAGVNPVLLDPPGAGLQTINGPITINGNLVVNGTINGGSTIYTVAFSATPVFDGHLGSSFKITLTGNVVSSSIENMAGKILVPFRIIQDGAGGRAWVWPPNVRGGGDVNPGPNAISAQLFALDTDGSMDAVGPIMYS